MRRLLTFSFLLRTVLCLILVGQIWTNTVSFCHWMIDSEIELIELNSSEDNESEKENDKKDQEDKDRANLIYTPSNSEFLLQTSFLFMYFISLHHPEITTPPPELLHSFL